MALELNYDFICLREKGVGELLEGYYWITLSFNFADAAFPDQKFSPHFCCSLGFI